MFDESRVQYTIEARQDDVHVRGNAIASGNDDYDRRVEDEILARLDGGDVWAWAYVCVVATYPGIDGIEGRDYLGCCSYASELDFANNSGYYEDMKKAACADLEAKLAAVAAVLYEG